MHSLKGGYHMFVHLSQVVTASPSILLPVLQMKAIVHCVELQFPISMVRPFALNVSVNASDLLQDALMKNKLFLMFLICPMTNSLCSEIYFLKLSIEEYTIIIYMKNIL